MRCKEVTFGTPSENMFSPSETCGVFSFVKMKKMIVRRGYSMILSFLWIKQDWRQLNTAFLICFSTRPDISIRATVKYWRF